MCSQKIKAEASAKIDVEQVLSQQKTQTNPKHAELVNPVKLAYRGPMFTFKEGGNMNGGTQPEQDCCINIHISSYQCQQGQGVREEERPLNPGLTQMYSLLV